MLSALQADDTHSNFLREMTGMTARQIRRAISSEIAYQALAADRSANLSSDDAYLFICPDKDTSDDIEPKRQRRWPFVLVGWCSPLVSGGGAGLRLVL